MMRFEGPNIGHCLSFLRCSGDKQNHSPVPVKKELTHRTTFEAILFAKSLKTKF